MHAVCIVSRSGEHSNDTMMSLCEWCMARRCYLLLFVLIDSISGDQGWTAVHIAAAQGHAGAVACLLDSTLFAVDDMDDQVRPQLQKSLSGLQQL